MSPQPEPHPQSHRGNSVPAVAPRSGAARIDFRFPEGLGPDASTYLREVTLAYISGVRDMHPGLERVPQLATMVGLPGRMIVYLTPEQIDKADARATDPEAKRLGTIYENSYSITDLGLVCAVEFSAGNLQVSYILTTDSCPAGNEFKGELGRAVVDLFTFLTSQGMELRNASIAKGNDTWDGSFVDDRLLGHVATAHRSLNLGCLPRQF